MKEFHTRAYLPHFQNDHLIQHIIFHLADSLPDHALESILLEISTLPDHEQEYEKRKRIEHWTDAGHGSCIFKHVEMASMMQNTLLHFQQDRYLLHAWCAMPNHVHVLVQP